MQRGFEQSHNICTEVIIQIFFRTDNQVKTTLMFKRNAVELKFSEPGETAVYNKTGAAPGTFIRFFPLIPGVTAIAT